MTDNYATGGYVSGPKPGDPPLVPDGCTLSRPERMPEPLPGVTVQVNLGPPRPAEVAEMLRGLRRRVR